MEISAVYAVVNFISDQFASLPCDVHRTTKGVVAKADDTNLHLMLTGTLLPPTDEAVGLICHPRVQLAASLGAHVTRSKRVSRNTVDGFSLSAVLSTDPIPANFFLNRDAKDGILTRMGRATFKKYPPEMTEALSR